MAAGVRGNPDLFADTYSISCFFQHFCNSFCSCLLYTSPEKPEGVEHKSAYIIGTGLAALTAACYLVRDAQMPGKRIHIFEKDPIPGGACDGYEYPGVGYVMRGGREDVYKRQLSSWPLLPTCASRITRAQSCPSWDLF